MVLKIDAKFDQKLTCGFKNETRNFKNFHQTLESLKIGTLIGFFYPKQKMYNNFTVNNKMMNTFIIVNITPTCKTQFIK